VIWQVVREVPVDRVVVKTEPAKVQIILNHPFVMPKVALNNILDFEH
jgi:hypothetical protein